jgi:hypothetical protein
MSVSNIGVDVTFYQDYSQWQTGSVDFNVRINVSLTLPLTVTNRNFSEAISVFSIQSPQTAVLPSVLAWNSSAVICDNRPSLEMLSELRLRKPMNGFFCHDPSDRE